MVYSILSFIPKSGDLGLQQYNVFIELMSKSQAKLPSHFGEGQGMGQLKTMKYK